ncbi:hypothetical protein J7443_08595 [Tropicibacter sp. R15_0]|uniref:hypothetical protein n=1 Tax=Tropicibacter sp. R15_0 TaxID=2821101 RepID=UPI001ADB6540|nr:hypothetical protein [Tropicibacter sp. R15_0]MBO9465282.1 hypothetical protein [Tropicibacter sp. R15_0]
MTPTENNKPTMFAQLDTLITRAPIGVHVPEQVAGSPHEGAHLLVKFINCWAQESPPGWSLLVQHPIGYSDLPFTTLTGVVGTDRFRDGYVHFPAHLSPEFEGVIAKGTPIAQLTPVQRQIKLETSVSQNLSQVGYLLKGGWGAAPPRASSRLPGIFLAQRNPEVSSQPQRQAAF